MIKLTGYTFSEKIYESQESIVYRGVRKEDSLPVIIKILNQEFPSEELLFSFKREYEMAKKVSGEDTLLVYDLVKYNNSLGIVMEDIDGITLSDVIHSLVISLAEKLTLSIKIADILSLIHSKNIIHKNINPSNIIWNRNTNRLEIIDFGLAVELKREMTHKMDQGMLEGTPSYSSPEQTGKINQPIDNRSDLYSLGVTLYELFTGQLPFASTDDDEIIYGHIAKKPEPPHLIKKNIPEMISIILLKLLAKDPEERYQKASGVKKDLEVCLESVLFDNSIIPFDVGKYDLSDQLKIPNKLYGRQDALETLNNSFNDVTNGNSAIVLIEGNSGYGKTSLVQEFSKTVAFRKGLFVSGKFDPLARNIPLHGILQALHDLIQWLLSLPENEIAFWKKNILSTVAPNASILTEILPELEKVIGAQPPVIELSPIEAHNRFLIILSDFISLFASTETPLVIFFDDLQWCDSTSLNLLKYIADKSKPSSILFIGAYRKNDLGIKHPLISAIEGLEKKPFSLQTLALQPLEITDIDQMVADTFHRSPPDEETLSLANLIYQKTGGSPFFIHQLLETLFELGFFELKEGKWIWDINQIRNTPISDNVSDLLSQKINEVNTGAIDILKIASCIGVQFDLEILSLVSKRKPAEIGTLLWPVIKNEIIYPLDKNYKMMHLEDKKASLSSVHFRFAFQHNRIQQLIYFQIPEQDRQLIHLKIGKELAKSIKNREDPDFMYNVVNHMNKGRMHITDFSERKALCELNTNVATKAMKSTIFSMASKYLTVAESLLTKEEWLQQPMKWYHVLYNLSEALFLSSELIKAEEICNKLFNLSDKPLDQAKVHCLKARILEFQGQIPETINEIRKGLQLFGVTLPHDPEEIERRIGEEMIKLEKIINTDDMIEKLTDLPLLEDEDKKITMELLFTVIAPALQFNPALYVLTSLMMFDISQKYGVTSFSCKSFVDVGINHSPEFKDFTIGYQLGHAAFRLINRLKAESMKPAAYFSFTFVSYRNKYYKEALQYFDMTYSTGIQFGDLQHAAYALVHKMHLNMQVGKKLSECREEALENIRFLNEIKTEMPLLLANLIYYFIKKYSSIELINNDDEYISKIHVVKNTAFLWRFYEYNTMYHYIHNDWEEAKKWSQLSDEFLYASLSDFPGPEHFMLKGLLIIKSWDSYSEKEKLVNIKTINDLLNNLENSATLCPSNFAHKFHFLSAEVAIFKKSTQEEILDHYNKALDSLIQDDFIHIRGLIYESLASFWQSLDNEMIAKAYLREAHHLFKKWGALKKVNMMEEKHPYLKPSSLKPVFISSQTHSISHSISNNTIDEVASITKAVQTISADIRIDKLMYTLLSLILENTGARQGALLLVNEEDKQLYVEAEKKSFNEEIEVMQSIHYRKSTSLCPEIIQYVARSLEKMLLGNACKEGVFKSNAHIQESQIKSILSTPILSRNKLVGVIYLEHDLAEDFFTKDKTQILKLLSSQAAISIENAKLYQSLEKKVHERTVQLNQANEKLRLLSLQDPLTTLHNRRYISEFVSEMSMNFITRKKQLQKDVEKRDLSITKKVLGVYMIDIDHFNKINDTYGLHAGDKVLINLSRLLKKQIRADDYIVRWGGEEFLIILNGTNPDFLDAFPQKVLKAVESNSIKISEDNAVNITCSIGYSMMPIHVLTPDLLNLEEVINISDVALSMAKENGRNRAVRIHVHPNIVPNLECREYLQKMSKNEPINNDFVEVITENTSTKNNQN